MIEKLGRYEILREIGQGGFAIVYEAQDTELDRRVALKELRPTLLHDTEWVEGFKREARTIARLDHPRIVTIFDVVDLEDRLFLAMRLVDGSSLDDLITTQGPLPWLQAIENITAMAEGLDYAHAQGILHRDLKPANILIDSIRGPLLSDFGMAKLVSEASTNVTASGSIVGTPHYIAPEVWEGHGTTPQSDIYALGCILYEMLTGEKLFQGQSPPSVMMAHFKPLTLPETWPENVPPDVANVLQTALAEQPGDRYSTAGEMAQDLVGLVANEERILSQAVSISRSHNLPVPPTSLIGREQELAEVRRLLLDEPTCRLLTLTGPGGTGKTRLSLRMATELFNQFADGVFLALLADITTPDLVVAKIGQQLNLREAGGQPLLEILKDYLRDKQMLLLLDNFEQVVEAAPIVADLLTAGPGLKILVTSRILLNLRGEYEFPVPPLELPDPMELPPLERLSQYEAIRLFVERAVVANPRFTLTNENASAVAEICNRLDGLPLAIELAAARIKLLPPQAMLTRLSSSLKLLTGGAKDLPARQQTLRNAIDWSYRLLDEDERTLFARLAVFVGGFSLEAAEAVCNPENNLDVLAGVESLLNNSLLRQEEGGDGLPRFRMLQTIHEYALEHLTKSGETEMIRRQHAHYFAAQCDEIGPKLYSADAVIWLEWIEDEHDNLRAALAWSLEVVGEIAVGVRIVFAITWFWYRRGHLSEGRDWSERVLAVVAKMGPSPERAMVLATAGSMAMWQGDLDTALNRMEEAVLLAQVVEDEFVLAFTLMVRGVVSINRGEDAIARPFLEESLAMHKEAGIFPMQATTLVHLGNVALGLGDHIAAQTWLDEASSLAQMVGDGWNISFVLNNRGEVARVQGDYEQARLYYKESEALLREMGDKGDLARLIHTLGYIAQHQSDNEEAEARFRESLAMFRELGNQRGIAECLAGLAGLIIEQGQPQRAAQLLGAAESLLSASKASWWPADRVEYERNLAAIRAALTEETFATARAEGQAMTLEQAINYASEQA